MSIIESPDTFFTSSGGSPPIPEAAIAYARQGLRLVPLKPGRKDPWRRPPGYQNLAPATESDIRNWFAQEPFLNIGLLTGHGIIVIDVDEHDGKMSGAEALAALGGIYGPLPVTLTSVTGSGGRHLIFRLPPGYDFGNRLPIISECLRTTTGKATGGVIDVRGNGGLTAPEVESDQGSVIWAIDPSKTFVFDPALPSAVVNRRDFRKREEESLRASASDRLNKEKVGDFRPCSI